MKHKFKRMRRFAYLVISKCEHCGLQREKLPDGKYLFGDFGKQTEQDPGCVVPNKDHNVQGSVATSDDSSN